MDGWMAGWMDGWLDGWMDGWMDGWLDRGAVLMYTAPNDEAPYTVSVSCPRSLMSIIYMMQPV